MGIPLLVRLYFYIETGPQFFNPVTFKNCFPTNNGTVLFVHCNYIVILTYAVFEIMDK